ncbi:MAG: excinuclease ABC subunit UvrB [Bacteroidota bacterium]|jgi:excinuclease ABC subunit B
MPSFSISSPFKPTGDQPAAIAKLIEGISHGEKHQVLLGVTGSGKTFTIANVIQQIQRPTLVLSHNKTLAAQLYGEFKQFFPQNAVEYFVSYYDYYQPEAYIPTTNTYIEKDLSINDEIEKLRISTTHSLMSGRRDVIVVSSVSCIYGMGNPDDFKANTIRIKKGMVMSRNQFLHALVNSLYVRTTADFNRGSFRVKGDTVDIYLSYTDYAFRVFYDANTIEGIESFDPISGHRFDSFEEVAIAPANLFVTSKESMKNAMNHIQDDMVKQVEYFVSNGKHLEAKRIEERVTYDLEMMRELGYCSGIENYSRYFDNRKSGERPFCLLDYFPDDFLMVVDESHVTIPQIRAMYGGDRSRKINLVEYGFRLPAALDNRPLTFQEFEGMAGQLIFVSATPADYELEKTGGAIVEQIIRPTGLLDPVIEVRPATQQVDDLLEEIAIRVQKNERVLVTTLTKRMAEELSKYLANLSIKCRYIHSDVDTLERVDILRDLRLGTLDVLIGVNLLREGLDLPEVSLVAVLDADKEGFLRSQRSLVQTAGRAARNLEGKVILYADKITDSMHYLINETERRRVIQMKYNTDHQIVPSQIIKSKEAILGQTKVADHHFNFEKAQREISEKQGSKAAESVEKYYSREDLEKKITALRKQMQQAAKDLDFIEAARLRDEMYALEKLR